MKLKITLILLVMTYLQVNAQNNEVVMGPSNRSTTSMEKNMLFNATSHYTVTQSGGNTFDLKQLFDGYFAPQYSGAMNETNPYVVLIEGLPNINVQAGAWIGWTTRFYAPVKFKVEICNTYDYGGSPGYPLVNDWITVADVDNYSAYNYIVPVSVAAVGKIRFTFYKGDGPANSIGLSELFFIHPEATRAYDNLMVQYSTDGNVGIGTTTPQEKLSVNGKIRAKEIKVETANWPDYVFNDSYRLTDLKETAEFIKKNKHLPGVPSAAEAEKEGIELGEMNKVLLKKIEELTLHLIEKDKQLENQLILNKEIVKRLEKLENKKE
ncbi:hypothetical protein [Pedobacter sp.]|uniref:hypothetical protein n=1 Tax=Pedobacter sp. TaxID=1411316 RepID=UPI00396C5994